MLHDGSPLCATGTFTIVCCMMRLDLCEKARLHALLSDIMCTMDSPDGITGFGDSVGTRCMCQLFGSYDTLGTHCMTNFKSILNSLVHHPQKYERKNISNTRMSLQRGETCPLSAVGIKMLERKGIAAWYYFFPQTPRLTRSVTPLFCFCMPCLGLLDCAIKA